MKSLIRHAFFWLSLSCIVIALSGMLQANLVFAANEQLPQPECSLVATGTDAIPGEFSVTKCLTAPGQTQLVGTSTERPIGGVAGFLIKAIDLLVKLIASLALIVFILGALLTITSEGKEDRLEKGKTAMFYALIGLIVAGFSFIIVTFVQSVLF